MTALLSTAEIRYGVRYTLPGETEQRIEPVGSPCLGDELIRDLYLQHGVIARVVHHYETPWEEL